VARRLSFSLNSLRVRTHRPCGGSLPRSRDKKSPEVFVRVERKQPALASLVPLVVPANWSRTFLGARAAQPGLQSRAPPSGRNRVMRVWGFGVDISLAAVAPAG